MAAPAEPQAPLIDAQQLADALGEKMTKHKVYRLARERKIPHYKLGARHIRFDLAEVRAHLARSSAHYPAIDR